MQLPVVKLHLEQDSSHNRATAKYSRTPPSPATKFMLVSYRGVVKMYLEREGHHADLNLPKATSVGQDAQP